MRETTDKFGAVENLRHAKKRFFKVSFGDGDVGDSGREAVVPRGDRGHAQYQRSAISWKRFDVYNQQSALGLVLQLGILPSLQNHSKE